MYQKLDLYIFLNISFFVTVESDILKENMEDVSCIQIANTTLFFRVKPINFAFGKYSAVIIIV